MAISYDHYYGGSVIAHNNEIGVNLLSDGRTLAMRWEDRAFIMSGFSVTNMTDYTEHMDVSFIGDLSPRHVPKSRHIEVSLTSCGPVKVVPASQLDTLFLNANDLSVDELLKLAYKKIDKRSTEENS
jgi:hypothetical protein